MDGGLALLPIITFTGGVTDRHLAGQLLYGCSDDPKVLSAVREFWQAINASNGFRIGIRPLPSPAPSEAEAPPTSP
ncbi:MAG: hypothetical protein LBH53_02340 [Puniceicoccales bacterium]|jgi:hypothetical protein|nr:hypothetical protein [Puniceicoccales bacterium]